jgi:riboflavin synthase
MPCFVMKQEFNHVVFLPREPPGQGGRMFTGIIEAVGHIRALAPSGGDVRVQVATGKLDLADVRLGDSIAVNGVCLTAVGLPGDGFWADVSRETLARTAFDDLKPGSAVNLEKALTPTSRLGGHLVSGHVDGVGEIVRREDNARAVQFRVRAPRELAKYIALKGSITVDGTSLTVNAVDGAEFELTIVPHTLAETIMADYRPGRRVNLEVDLLARYLERLLLGDKAAEPQGGGITEGFLAEHGFLNR